LKWVKDLKISTETLKLLQERVGNTVEYTGIDNNFLNRTPVAQQFIEWIETKNLLHKKENDHQTEAHRRGENLCQLNISQRTDNQNILEVQIN
jgi:hypothetical protein